MKPVLLVSNTVRIISVWVGLIPLLGTAIFAEEEQPPHVQLTAAAWDALNSGTFERSIAKADKCIEKFVEVAKKEQQELENHKTPKPPTGTVTEEEKATVLHRGPLNDVATCYYIKGRALEALKRMEDAKRAYDAARRLTYGRCWDPKGWFWSPSEEASERLAALQQPH